MNHTVLLVDDDANVLHGLARALRHQPYQLFTARSGDEVQLAVAIRKALEHKDLLAENRHVLDSAKRRC